MQEEHLLQKAPLLADLAVHIAEKGTTSLGGFATVYLRMIKTRPQLQQRDAPIGREEASYQLVVSTGCEFNVPLTYSEAFYSVYLGADSYWLAGWMLNKKESRDVLFPLRYQNQMLDSHRSAMVTYAVVGGMRSGRTETWLKEEVQ